MVPKRSKTSGAGKSGSATRRRRPARPSCTVVSPNITPPAFLLSEPVQPTEPETSSHAPAAPAEGATPPPLIAPDLTEAIEREREELLQIQAMLKCLYEVLLYADDDDSVMHADVAHVCARLITESVHRLGDLLMPRDGRNRRNELDDAAVSES